MEQNFIKDNADVLATTLSFFSTLLLKEPPLTLLKSIQEQSLFNNWYISYMHNNDVITDLINKVNHELQLENAYKDIKYDYTQLLIYGYDKIGAVPWGSVYLNQSNETFTDETREVEKIYYKYQFSVTEEFTEPLDHIGIELLFLAYLIENINTLSVEKYTETINDVTIFLQQYVLSYSYSFIKHLKTNAKTNFYQLIAFLLEDFLLQIEKELNVVKDPNIKIYY